MANVRAAVVALVILAISACSGLPGSTGQASSIPTPVGATPSALPSSPAFPSPSPGGPTPPAPLAVTCPYRVPRVANLVLLTLRGTTGVIVRDISDALQSVIPMRRSRWDGCQLLPFRGLESYLLHRHERGWQWGAVPDRPLDTKELTGARLDRRGVNVLALRLEPGRQDPELRELELHRSRMARPVGGRRRYLESLWADTGPRHQP